MAKQISIRQGSMTRKVEVDDNATVADVRNKYGARMDLTKEHQAHMSTAGGKPTAASDDTTLDDGAVLEFSRTTGQKG